jgi:UDPglucose--hexose-1-phosphate uridylyltransferase
VTDSVVKRAARLADGRDLFYFDDANTTLGPERAIDTRKLDARPETAQMRLDVLTGEWISIVTARQNRVFLPPQNADPLAPQTPGNPSEIPANYDVAVFENRSPSFGPALADGPDPLDRGNPSAIEQTRRAIGRCEVVCFSPEPTGSFATQTPSRARTIIEAWSDRTAELSKLPGVEEVFVFENRGEAVGVTLHHPHGQIYAYPYVTPRTRRTLASLDELGPDLFQRILDTERDGPRVVLAGEHWTAFIPFAARWPLEIHLLPHRHVPDFPATSDEERSELADLYLRLLRGVDAIYDSPTPYIAAWHQAPVKVGRERVRLSLQLTSPRRARDRFKFLAGSESAMGAWIGDVAPEAQAEQVREAIAAA